MEKVDGSAFELPANLRVFFTLNPTSSGGFFLIVQWSGVTSQATPNRPDTYHSPGPCIVGVSQIWLDILIQYSTVGQVLIKKYRLKTLFLLFMIGNKKQAFEVLSPIDQANPFVHSCSFTLHISYNDMLDKRGGGGRLKTIIIQAD